MRPVATAAGRRFCEAAGFLPGEEQLDNLAQTALIACQPEQVVRLLQRPGPGDKTLLKLLVIQRREDGAQPTLGRRALVNAVKAATDGHFFTVSGNLDPAIPRWPISGECELGRIQYSGSESFKFPGNGPNRIARVRPRMTMPELRFLSPTPGLHPFGRYGIAPATSVSSMTCSLLTLPR